MCWNGVCVWSVTFIALILIPQVAVLPICRILSEYYFQPFMCSPCSMYSIRLSVLWFPVRISTAYVAYAYKQVGFSPSAVFQIRNSKNYRVRSVMCSVPYSASVPCVPILWKHYLQHNVWPRSHLSRFSSLCLAVPSVRKEFGVGLDLGLHLRYKVRFILKFG